MDGPAMTQEQFKQLQDTLKAYGFKRTDGSTDMDKVKSFLKDLDSIKDIMSLYLACWDSRPFSDGIAMDKQGKLYLINGHEMTCVDGMMKYTSVIVVDKNQKMEKKPIEEFVEYSSTSKVLFSKEKT